MRFFAQDGQLQAIGGRGPRHQAIRIAGIQDIAHFGRNRAEIEMFGPQQSDLFTG